MLNKYIYLTKPVTIQVNNKTINIKGFHTDATRQLILLNKHYLIYINIKYLNISNEQVTFKYYFKTKTIDKIFFSNVFNLKIDKKNKWTCSQYFLNENYIICYLHKQLKKTIKN